MKKLTLEEAKIKLEKLTNQSDPLMNAFHMGRVGFRKDSKRRANEIEKSIDKALEICKLREFIDKEEHRLAKINEPIKPSPYCESPNDVVVGQKVKDIFFGWVTVTKINKNTITIQTDSNYQETRKPSFIYKPILKK